MEKKYHAIITSLLLALLPIITAPGAKALWNIVEPGYIIIAYMVWGYILMLYYSNIEKYYPPGRRKK